MTIRRACGGDYFKIRALTPLQMKRFGDGLVQQSSFHGFLSLCGRLVGIDGWCSYDELCCPLKTDRMDRKFPRLSGAIIHTVPHPVTHVGRYRLLLRFWRNVGKVQNIEAGISRKTSSIAIKYTRCSSWSKNKSLPLSSITILTIRSKQVAANCCLCVSYHTSRIVDIPRWQPQTCSSER
jgi:hypothetical protein